MKVLFLNNYHYLRGGSEQVYFGEMNLLKVHGYEVEAFARTSSEDIPSKYEAFFPKEITTDSISFGLGTLRTLKEIIYSSESKKMLRNVLNEITPDLAHAHNVYGRLTTSVLDALNKNNIPVVMTLHDYKLICPSYKLMHNNKVCEACLGGNYYRAVFKKCHKDSYAASAIYVFESWFNSFFKKYQNNIEFLIAPSIFLKTKLVEFGWDKNQIEYIPNYIDTVNFLPDYKPGEYFLYIGRLSSEKGIQTLITAFKAIENDQIKLKIVGDGPEKENLKMMAKDDSRIGFTGYLSGVALESVTRKARAVVVPSEWYENAPISILEAFAYGKPVIGAEIGGIPEMIDTYENGLLFESGSTEDLIETFKYFLKLSEHEIEKMGKSARKKAEALYNPEMHFEKLSRVYQKAMDIKATK